MKKVLIVALSFILIGIASSCTREVIEENLEELASNTLPKYPQEPIKVIAGEKNALGEVMEVPNTRATYFLRDSVWSNGQGHTLIYETNEHYVTSDAMRYIYLGSILRGGSIETQRFMPISVPTDPIDISYSFPARWVTDRIEYPSLGAQRQSIRDVMAQQGMTGNQIVSFVYDMNSFTYYSEAKLAFGCNIDVAKILNIGVDVNKQKIRSKTGLIAKFIQRNFTIDMDIPRDGCLLLDNDALPGIDQYDPVYISSVTVGRMGIMTIESNYDYDDLRVAVKVAFEAGVVNGELNISSEHKKILEEADIHMAVVYGDGQGATASIEGFNEFKNFIIEGGRFTPEQPGDVIFYTGSYLSDNSPFYCKFHVDIPYN